MNHRIADGQQGKNKQTTQEEQRRKKAIIICQFKSGVILKNKCVIAQGSNDSHSDLLQELGIKDDYIGMTKTFVRAELIPQNDEWWVNPAEEPSKWNFIVDQDEVPEWFDKEKYEAEFREYVCDWWKAHVLVDQKVDELSSGYYRLKRCEVKKLCQDVKVLLDNSTVKVLLDNSTVTEMLGNSTVTEMWGNSTVTKMLDNSTVTEMLENSTVTEMLENSTVTKMLGNSTVTKMWGNSTVTEMLDNSTVTKMWGNSTVTKMWGNSTVRDFKQYPHIKIMVADTGNFEMVAFKNEQVQ